MSEWLLGSTTALGAAILLWTCSRLSRRLRRAGRKARRKRMEDVLKHLYESEIELVAPNLRMIAGATHLSGDETAAVLQDLQSRRLIEIESEGIRLTASGRELGLNVLRAHRLMESYLADHTGFPEAEWHNRAHDLEHGLSVAEVDALSARLQHPTHDPHGDPIPTSSGEFSTPQGIPLPTAPLDSLLRIVHVEDEPAAVYSQIMAVGVHPGMLVRLTEASPRRVRLLAGWNEHVLAPLVAANVTVQPVDRESAQEPPEGVPLSSIGPGEGGRVVALSPRCRGAERRRLMDLGILPGTAIFAEIRSPNGDPTAYRIRDALIALREEQAEMIQVERLSGSGVEAA
jgi:DtxR family Mn-dependent transcriptional regulator